MPSRSKNKPAKPRAEARPARPADAAPPIETALPQLAQRSVRAAVWLVIRLVAVAVLTTMLVRQAPGLRSFRLVLDFIGALLVLVPFLTALGRNYGWRIRLGRAYATEERWADAETALGVLTGLRATLFDATGEGRYHLARVRRALGKREESARLFAEVAGQGSAEWREKAAREASADAVPS